MLHTEATRLERFLEGSFFDAIRGDLAVVSIYYMYLIRSRFFNNNITIPRVAFYCKKHTSSCYKYNLKKHVFFSVTSLQELKQDKINFYLKIKREQKLRPVVANSKYVCIEYRFQPDVERPVCLADSLRCLKNIKLPLTQRLLIRFVIFT